MSICSQLSILIPGEMFRDEYVKRGLQTKNLSRTLEDSATVIEPIVPWTAAGVYMATTLGVPTLSYLPWAILCYTGVIFALIWGYTGFGIAKIDEKDEHYEEYLRFNEGNLFIISSKFSPRLSCIPATYRFLSRSLKILYNL